MKRLLFMSAAATICGACMTEPELPPVQWEGQRIRFRSDEALDSVCAGTLSHLDDRAAHMAEIFGAPRRVVDYVWAPGAALGEYCELPTLGCAVDGRSYSVFALDEHELFHAVTSPPAHRGLEEGLAVAFGDDRELPGTVEGTDLPAILAEVGRTVQPAAQDYPRLGHFVSYLRSNYGVGGLAELAANSEVADGREQLDASLQLAFGDHLETVLDDYGAYPVCDSTHFHYDGFDCGRNIIPLPADGAPKLDSTLRVACDEPETLGPRSGEQWTLVTLSVPAEGRYLLSVYPTNGVSANIRLRRCDASCAEVDDWLPPDGGFWMGLNPCLRQGLYSLRLAVPVGTAGEFRIEATRLDGGSCD
ncbi:MAG: hypothetical protein K0V04_44820 [Deltaproteobacteria bacterium]|nr:hypothetical protein [Deltaproteobacteria bacterium]